MLPDLTYEAGTQDDDIPALEFIPVANGTKHDKAVLGYYYASARTTKEIAAYLGISDSSYLRKSILENLVSAGCLIEMTIGRSKAYKTNPEAVRIL